NVLNWLLERKGYTTIKCGIGMAYGRALMLKAGFKGSGINDIVWMGDVVNEASNLCHQGNKEGRATVQVSTTVYGNLNEDNQKLLTPVYHWTFMEAPKQYEGNVIERNIEQWLKEQKEKARAHDTFMESLFSGEGLLNSLVSKPTEPWSLADLFKDL